MIVKPKPLFATVRFAGSAARLDVGRRLISRAETFCRRWLKWSIAFFCTSSVAALLVSTHVSPLSTHQIRIALNSGATVPYAALPASRDLTGLLAADTARREHILAGSLLEAGFGTLSLIPLRRQLAQAPDNRTLQAAVGEALVLASRGIVVPEAKQIFERVLSNDPNDLVARFYMAHWLLQNGQAKPALVKLVGLMRTAGDDTFWNDKLWEVLPIAGDRLGISRLALLALCAPGM